MLDRAEQARVEAEAATLEHVRERCRRSEAAWRVLAERARRGEQLRFEEQERKAAMAAELTNEDHIQEPELEVGLSASKPGATGL